MICGAIPFVHYVASRMAVRRASSLGGGGGVYGVGWGGAAGVACLARGEHRLSFPRDVRNLTFEQLVVTLQLDQLQVTDLYILLGYRCPRQKNCCIY